MSTIAHKNPDLKSYSSLLSAVRKTIESGKERALAAVEREQVRTAWETGKLIHEHILLNNNRAVYGGKVVIRLAKDLSMGARELRYMVEFYRAYPIVRPAAQLPWSYYETLLGLNDPEKRKAISKEAVKNNWKRDRLRLEIKKLKAADPKAVSEALKEEPLIPLKGILDTYRIVIAKAGPWIGKPVIDQGFSTYHAPSGPLPFREKEIIQVSPTGGLIRLENARETDLFTFRAYLLEVTDADTHWYLVDLGFDTVTRQHLRLRGIDCPELNTRAGQEAKRYVERVLKRAKSITITTSKSDKYDRYLSDVFYQTGKRERYLNQELLDKGYAVRV